MVNWFVRWIFALGKIFRVKTPCYAILHRPLSLEREREEGRVFSEGRYAGSSRNVGHSFATRPTISFIRTQ